MRTVRHGLFRCVTVTAVAAFLLAGCASQPGPTQITGTLGLAQRHHHH